MIRAVAVGLPALLLLVLVAGGAPARLGVGIDVGQPQERAVPLLAYYYIWFDESSWDRAKTDWPELGPYSSDSRTVMRRHVEWARAAGIDGFIVSWKDTPRLNRRLQRLIEVARSEDFKLAVIYQGLDFERRPLPAERVGDDLSMFADRWGADPVFDLFGRPLVVWSGTWEFSTDEIAAQTGRVRDRLLVLGSERSPDEIARLAGLTDGNAYYWSSVDPDGTPQYAERLEAMAELVHAGGGLWIAPAAPGFDARLIGGTRRIERDEGETLRKQLTTALASQPDAIGLISWNEFSENSHVEPSIEHGRRYLDVLRAFAPSIGGLPGSDDDPDAPPATAQRTAALALLALAGVGGAVQVMRRDRGRRPPDPEELEGGTG